MLIEGGFAWVPALRWRLDKHWERFKSEVPHLKRAPSEYVREHFRFTTQPIDEPENPRDMRDVIDWVGGRAVDVLDRLSALGLRRPALRAQSRLA